LAKTIINNNREPEVATPSDSESSGDEVVDDDDSDVDQSSLDVEQADGLTPVATILLQEEANSCASLAYSQIPNLYCESCSRANMKGEAHTLVRIKKHGCPMGAVATRDHIVSTQDKMLGIDGSRAFWS
jgi:hypothetical protein